ncbi:hypothetical protein KY336_03335 [Candidatus Woesearchaeota archaeon]|nr:hypothetical protein [Candidatus Woesearchaeota archaeon]
MKRINQGSIGSDGLAKRFETRGGLEKEVETVPDLSGIETNIYLAPYNPLHEEIVEDSINKVEAGSCYVSIFFETRFDTSGYVEVPNVERKSVRTAFLRALDVFSRIALNRNLDLSQTGLIIQVLYEDRSERPDLEKYYEQLANHVKDVTVYCKTFSEYEKELKEVQ